MAGRQGSTTSQPTTWSSIVAHIQQGDDGSEVHAHTVIVPPELHDLRPRRGDVPAARAVPVGPLVPRAGDRSRTIPIATVGARSSACGQGPIDESPSVSGPPGVRAPHRLPLVRMCRRRVGSNGAHRGVVARLTALLGDPFHPADLHAAAHETDLRPRRDVIVHADVIHRGLGTASCGPDILERYRVDPGTYRFTYRLVAGDRRTPGPAGGRSGQAGRQAVPDDEALGEAEGLQLAHVVLEWLRLPTRAMLRDRVARRRAGPDELEHTTRVHSSAGPGRGGPGEGHGSRPVAGRRGRRPKRNANADRHRRGAGGCGRPRPRSAAPTLCAALRSTRTRPGWPRRR